MRIVEVTRYGGPDVLVARTAPDPSPAPGQVLVAVEFAEVLFLDTQLRAGWGQDYFPMRPPWVPGTGVVGRVVAVGEGVATDRIGARVIARTGDEGGYVELVAVAADEAFDVPDGLDDGAVALAALHDGPLALDRLQRVELGAGTRVLVTAAAGSLGHWLAPLAKATGAEVVGAAGGPDKCAAVLALGADAALDYRRGDWADPAGPFAGPIGGPYDGPVAGPVATPFDVVFDGAGGAVGRTAFARTRDGGAFFAHGAAAGEFGATGSERGITVVGVDAQLDEAAWRRHTRTALEVLARGQVRPTIGQRVPLEHAAAAHAAIADRTVIGKSVLVV